LPFHSQQRRTGVTITRSLIARRRCRYLPEPFCWAGWAGWIGPSEVPPPPPQARPIHNSSEGRRDGGTGDRQGRNTLPYRLGRFAKTTPTCTEQSPGPACLVVVLPTILLPTCLRTLLEVLSASQNYLLYTLLLLDPATSTTSVLPVCRRFLCSSHRTPRPRPVQTPPYARRQSSFVPPPTTHPSRPASRSVPGRLTDAHTSATTSTSDGTNLRLGVQQHQVPSTSRGPSFRSCPAPAPPALPALIVPCVGVRPCVIRLPGSSFDTASPFLSFPASQPFTDRRPPDRPAGQRNIRKPP
jgi:hypothetical protein